MTQQERIVQLERAVLYLAKALNGTVYALEAVGQSIDDPSRAPRQSVSSSVIGEAREALKKAVDLLSLEDASVR
ncbi:MAG: hypothetical protein ACKO1J_20505 [Tagaea sp.]